MSIIGLVVVLIVICLVYWAVHRIAGAFGIPDQILVIFDVLLVVIFVLWLLQAFGVLNVGSVRIGR